MADAKSSIYKVAIASTDGENVNLHYGKADRFFIYQIDDETGYDLLEERQTEPACLGGSHDAAKMEESVLRLTDCRYVVAARIGRGAGAVLTANGIIGMELPGSADDAILKIWKYNRIQGLFN